jgi:hypothetical protein
MTENTKNPDTSEPDKIVANSDFEIFHYSIDQEGNWNRKMIANWGAKEIVNTQTWLIVQERINAAKDKIRSGEMSPIGFYMVKCIMDAKLCSEFTGIPVWKVKKHMKPKNFDKLKPEYLKKYADAFEVTVEELTHLKEQLINETKTDA